MHPNIYRDVLDFNRAVLPGKVDRTEHGPSVPPEDSRLLGARLVSEEYEEMMEAVGVSTDEPCGCGCDCHQPARIYRPASIENVVDAAADLFYVILGVVQRFGISEEQFYRVWAEVTRANMAKADGPRRADGKRLKPDGWTPPNIEAALWPERQLPL
jgi:predicted HAD superfamily Cof-like phosphohydrolase